MRTKHGLRNRKPAIPALVLAGLVQVAACGGDDGPTEPNLGLSEAVGTWALTELSFDPQGVLAETDVLAQLGTAPQLIVTNSRAAQIVYQDPATGLFVTIQGSVRMTSTGARLEFNNNTGYEGLFLGRTMEFQLQLGFSGGRILTFDGDAPGSVNRQRLIQLVPAWQTEQLLDPVPGRLRVVFARP